MYLLNSLFPQNPLPHVWKLLSSSFKMWKNMASLPFIFCWSKHIFSMVIQFFTEKHFSSNFWTADPLNVVDPPFFSFLIDLHTDNPWWPIRISKTSNGVEWDWIMPHDVFFLKLIKNCWGQQKYLTKSSQGHNIWKQQYSSFLMGRYSSKSHKWFRNQNH